MRPSSVAGDTGIAHAGIGQPRLRIRCSRPSTRLPPADSPASTMRDGAKRSEEHTSELQSLMRISYAVFCLKKKRQNTKITDVADRPKQHDTSTYTKTT